MKRKLKRWYRSKKLHTLHRHIREINGMKVIPRKWVLAYLSKTELSRFERRYKWWHEYSQCQCTCGNIHLNRKKYKRYAQWWNLVTLIDGKEKVV